MILKSLRLKNIRSYLNELIAFPQGSLLLSGDIGTGKSTILLAIEFALFGIQRGTLSGQSLLRAGKSEGSVELIFLLDKREVIIKRTLKRVKDGVVQSTGYIIIDGLLQDCTAIELKTRILDLLGYPKDLLTKKLLIYRYTVYTPQEEMKQILFEDKETRLDLLRRVFNIDRYKKVKENAQVYIRELKERAKRFEGLAEDIIDVENEHKAVTKKLEEVNTQLEMVQPELHRLQDDIITQKNRIWALEEDRKKLLVLQAEFESLAIELKHVLHRKNENSFRIEELQKQLGPLESETALKEIDLNIPAKIKIKQEEIALLEKQQKALNSRIGELTNRQTYALTTMEKIKKLNSCPVCLQEVNLTHKEYITGKEKKNFEQCESLLEGIDRELKDTDSKLRLIKDEVDALRGQEKESVVLRLRQKALAEKQGLRKQLEDEQGALSAKIEVINAKKLELFEKIKQFGNFEERYLNEKEKIEELLASERSSALREMALSKERESLAWLLNKAGSELKRKQKARDFLEKTRRIQSWLDSYFLVLIDIIEKHVMANIHYKFSQLFAHFFKELLEDDNTTTRLDETFTPIITQNGYEVNVEALSGGEKTSCALAYRLALNKVINDILSTIKTRDLLILDEPTDGFSTEQLDNLKNVLNELSTSQIIIVSHEPNVESFVDSIIEISKVDHTSSSIPRSQPASQATS